MSNEWKMPEWMEPYRSLFVNTGGNKIEELVNDKDKSMMTTNILRYILKCSVESQVGLLEVMKREGKLSVNEEGK